MRNNTFTLIFFHLQLLPINHVNMYKAGIRLFMFLHLRQLWLQSVRDAADIYLSLKYTPPLFVLDTPCGFSRHVNLREPERAAKYWGDTLGCFEKPSLEVQPNQIFVI